MKKLNAISLVACGVLLSSSMAFGASTIGSAFKDGKASGSLALYGTKHNVSKAVNSGYGNANAAVAFETDSLYGITAKGEVKGNLELGEVEKDDRKNAPFENDALITESYLKYTNDAFFVSAGRQAIDLEWLADYNESVVVGITAVPDTVVVVGWTKRKAESGIDVSYDFADINGTKGAYVADVKYTGLKSVEFNPYAYSVPDVADWYGLKSTFTADYFGAIAHYATSQEDTQANGSIGHVELNTKYKDATAAIGYIKTDKTGGIGSMNAAGDNISPLDTGDKVYREDAKTLYGSVGYTIASIELGAIYGVTTYTTNDYKEKELNLTASYPVTEALTAAVLYGDIDGDTADGVSDDKYVLASVEYKF